MGKSRSKVLVGTSIGLFESQDRSNKASPLKIITDNQSLVKRVGASLPRPARILPGIEHRPTTCIGKETPTLQYMGIKFCSVGLCVTG